MRKRIPIIPRRELIVMSLLSGSYSIARIAKTFDWKPGTIRKIADGLGLPFDEKGNPVLSSGLFRNHPELSSLPTEEESSEQSE